MNEKQTFEISAGIPMPGSPVPAARPLADFSWEQLGDDLVLFDAETTQYHTLNAAAVQIWRACDGATPISQIAGALGLAPELVETTVSELGEGSLLASPAAAWSASLNRRRAAKLIAAGAVGAIGLPVVLSLTAPSHQVAASPGTPCTYQYNSRTDASCTVGDSCFYQSSYVIYCCVFHGHGTNIWWTDCAAV